ncbi:MAG: hypothetical protein AB7U95_10065 [Reyranella sp.]
MARATGGPKKPSPLAAVWNGMTALARRLAAMEARPAARDGVGVASGLVDASGNLVLTLTDGRLVPVGNVVGPPATPPAASDVADLAMDRLRPLVDTIRRDNAALVASEVKAVVAALPAPEPGKSVTINDVRPLVESAVAAAMAALPAPERGKDADPEVVRQMVADAVAELPEPQPGKDADPEVTAAIVRDAVAAAVAALPAPKPGAPGVGVSDAVITGEGRLAIVLTDGRRVDAGAVPKPDPGPPGRSVASGHIDDRGHLVLVFTDGAEEMDLGKVTGEPGASIKGEPGRGIAEARIEGGDLVLSFSDGSTQRVGRVKGTDAKPAKAVKGDPGPPGRLKVTDVRAASLRPEDLDDLHEIEIEAEDGRTIILYGRA